MARKVPEINSSSQADIAFLLLCFFLMTTSMDVDYGIVELDIHDYNGRCKDPFYVYRIKIHKGDPVYIDPDWQWRSAVFKFGNIKPEDIEYLGQGSEGLKNMYK